MRKTVTGEFGKYVFGNMNYGEHNIAWTQHNGNWLIYINKKLMVNAEFGTKEKAVDWAKKLIDDESTKIN